MELKRTGSGEATRISCLLLLGASTVLRKINPPFLWTAWLLSACSPYAHWHWLISVSSSRQQQPDQPTAGQSSRAPWRSEITSYHEVCSRKHCGWVRGRSFKSSLFVQNGSEHHITETHLKMKNSSFLFPRICCCPSYKPGSDSVCCPPYDIFPKSRTTLHSSRFCNFGCPSCALNNVS